LLIRIYQSEKAKEELVKREFKAACDPPTFVIQEETFWLPAK
jgi:hypothetical protein